MSSVRSSTQIRAPPARDVRSEKKGKPNVHYPFWFGGSASCFAACVTHPLDLGKFYRFNVPEIILTIIQ
jgi:hypothetical protein